MQANIGGVLQGVDQRYAFKQWWWWMMDVVGLANGITNGSVPLARVIRMQVYERSCRMPSMANGRGVRSIAWHESLRDAGRIARVEFAQIRMRCNGSMIN